MSKNINVDIRDFIPTRYSSVLEYAAHLQIRSPPVVGFLDLSPTSSPVQPEDQATCDRFLLLLLFNLFALYVYTHIIISHEIEENYMY